MILISCNNICDEHSFYINSYMIPCFSASNGTDAHHRDTISNRSSPSQFTKDSPSNISQVRTRHVQKIYTTA